jgi:hypothetical protein
VTVANGVNAIVFTLQAYGEVELCKQPGDVFTSGSFTFALIDSTNVSTTRSVLTGQCSAPVSAATGLATVVEAPVPNVVVTAISTAPASALASFNLVAGSASVVVSYAATVQTTFTNAAVVAPVKVCEILTPTSNDLAGQTFSFNLAGAAGSSSLSIVAVAGASGTCKLSPTSLPVGSSLTVTMPGVPLVAANGGVIGAGATQTVTVANGVNTVIFTIQAYGQLELCKLAGDATTSGSFTLTVTDSGGGVSAESVAVGTCVLALTLPPGTAGVAETPVAGEQVTGISTNPAGALLSQDFVDGTATVKIPGGSLVQLTYTNSATFTVNAPAAAPGSFTYPAGRLPVDGVDVSWPATAFSQDATIVFAQAFAPAQGAFNASGVGVQVTATAPDGSALRGPFNPALEIDFPSQCAAGVPLSVPTTSDDGVTYRPIPGPLAGPSHQPVPPDVDGWWCNGTTLVIETTHLSSFALQKTTPVLTVPGPITKEATGPGGAAVSYQVSATDPAGIASITCTPPSGSTFPLGTTTVSCTAKNTQGGTSTKSFTVTVADTTPPVLSGVPANITTTTVNASGKTVTYATPSATDLVDGAVPVSCVPPAGSTFPVGTTTVTCTATDAHTNSASRSFTVTVNLVPDTTAPSIDDLPKNNQQFDATGPAGASFTFQLSVSDPDDGGTFQCTGGPVASFPSPSAGELTYTVTNPVGMTWVACTATDSHGNSTTVKKAFKMTVRG